MTTATTIKLTAEQSRSKYPRGQRFRQSIYDEYIIILSHVKSLWRLAHLSVCDVEYLHGIVHAAVARAHPHAVQIGVLQSGKDRVNCCSIFMVLNKRSHSHFQRINFGSATCLL